MNTKILSWSLNFFSAGAAVTDERSQRRGIYIMQNSFGGGAEKKYK